MWTPFFFSHHPANSFILSLRPACDSSRPDTVTSPASCFCSQWKGIGSYNPLLLLRFETHIQLLTFVPLFLVEIFFSVMGETEARGRLGSSAFPLISIYSALSSRSCVSPFPCSSLSKCYFTEQNPFGAFNMIMNLSLFKTWDFCVLYSVTNIYIPWGQGTCPCFSPLHPSQLTCSRPSITIVCILNPILCHLCLLKYELQKGFPVSHPPPWFL